MIRRLVVLPDARGEIEEASDWYHERSGSLGSSFRAEIRACFARIRENPFKYQRLYREARSALLHRFPYSIVFVVQEPDVLVVACIHQRRDPLAWQARIP